MKKILILIIDLYQSFVSVILKNILGVPKICRFSPTCSEYAKVEIRKKGVFRGLVRSTVRVIKCQPFGN